MLRKTVLALSIAVSASLLITLGPLSAKEEFTGPAPVYNLEFRDGKTYHIVELVKKRREQISKWNILRLKRGEEYWTYKLLDEEYPLTMSNHEHRRYRRELRDVPDFRPYDQKYPDRYRLSQHYRNWGPVYNSLVGAVLQGVKQ